jgi:hypothetical protein
MPSGSFLTTADWEITVTGFTVPWPNIALTTAFTFIRREA